MKMKSKGAVAMENKLEKIGQNNFMDNFVKTDDILKDMCGIIESSQKAAYRAVNTRDMLLWQGSSISIRRSRTITSTSCFTITY